jgi:di/tricarboxylate transporter
MTDPSQVTIMSLGWPGWLSLGLVVLCFVLFIRTRIAPDIVTSGALTLLLVTGVLTPHEALAGFSNPGMLTVAVLYVVVTGLTETGAVGWIGQSLLGRPRGEHDARARLMLPVAALSAFLNNTPVVAIFIPAVQDWAKRYRLSLSRLLIPLSYASIAGGTCTLIGTSTNLVVDGLYAERSRRHWAGSVRAAWIGLPVVATVLLFTIFAGHRLLPSRTPAAESYEDVRRYTTEMLVAQQPLGRQEHRGRRTAPVARPVPDRDRAASNRSSPPSRHRRSCRTAIGWCLPVSSTRSSICCRSAAWCRRQIRSSSSAARARTAASSRRCCRTSRR